MVILGLLCFFGVSAVVLLAYAVTAVVVTGMVIVTAPMWIAFVVAGVLEVWAVVILGSPCSFKSSTMAFLAS